MSEEFSSSDDWDFYPCRVNDARASIWLNLSLARQLEQLGEDTLYAVHIELLEPDHHGMGSAAEAEILWPAEDMIVERLEALGLRYVGRLRNRSNWQITFMGPTGREPNVRDLVGPIAKSLRRRFQVRSKPDPEWSYYREFLYPNEERMSWIMDRREALEKQGDPLLEKRRVDHWLFFPDAAARAEFTERVVRQGFEPMNTPDEERVGVQIHRVDSVQLEEIHALTTELAELAASVGGEYDGWETEVRKPELTLA